ncbi:DUF6907 domain-containing protein [Streptomyces galilaeus]
MSEPRTVTLPTHDHGPVTLVCPPWCVSHEGQDDGARADISHEGREHVMTLPTRRGPAVLLIAGIEQRPYAEFGPGRGVFVNVEVSGDWHPVDAEGLEAMAAALTEHATTLRSLAVQLRAAGGAAL